MSQSEIEAENLPIIEDDPWRYDVEMLAAIKTYSGLQIDE
jgi:hypothetical protein